MSLPWQRTIWLGPCAMCGNTFFVDRQWYSERERETQASLDQCSGCHPLAHHGAPAAIPEDYQASALAKYQAKRAA